MHLFIKSFSNYQGKKLFIFLFKRYFSVFLIVGIISFIAIYFGGNEIYYNDQIIADPLKGGLISLLAFSVFGIVFTILIFCIIVSYKFFFSPP